jgi:ketosteroid isomerase-like protein
LAQSSDEEGVGAAVSAFYAALNACDIQAMEALWAPDANVIMIHPGAE